MVVNILSPHKLQTIFEDDKIVISKAFKTKKTDKAALLFPCRNTLSRGILT